MLKILDLVGQVAGRRATILITGETGTGKELAARALHAARGHGPWVAVNCSALPGNLLEAITARTRLSWDARLVRRLGTPLAQAAPSTPSIRRRARRPVSARFRVSLRNARLH